MTWENKTALTFDIVGTLINYRAGALKWLQKRLAQDGVEPNVAELSRLFQNFENDELNEHPTQDFTKGLPAVWSGIAHAYDVPVTASDGEAFMASIASWPPFADSVQELRTLGQRFRLVAITNADRWSAAKMSETLEHPFHRVLNAEDIGVVKPDFRPFQAALNYLEHHGVSADNVIHIAQGQQTDLEPANRLGLSIFWVNRYRDPLTLGEPTRTVSTLTEIREEIL